MTIANSDKQNIMHTVFFVVIMVFVLIKTVKSKNIERIGCRMGYQLDQW